jgi:hypothetical protein
MYKTEGTQYGSLCTEDSPGSALGYQDSAKGTWGKGDPRPGRMRNASAGRGDPEIHSIQARTPDRVEVLGEIAVY